jgi:hypothetical protein
MLRKVFLPKVNGQRYKMNVHLEIGNKYLKVIFVSILYFREVSTHQFYYLCPDFKTRQSNILGLFLTINCPAFVWITYKTTAR